MKNIVLILSFLSISAQLVGQNIPNGDFENWETRDHYKLDNWWSPTRNVERTTDAKVGNYALKLTNTLSNGYRGYIRNIDYTNRDSLNGFSVSGDPLSLVFWSKHDLADGDTARIYVVLRDHGLYRGKVDFRFSGSTNNEFVKYSVPISWNSSRTPDSAWIYLYSYVDAVDGDGYVIYDDIHFEKIGERMPDFTNNDFEDWTNIGTEYPVGWRTYDLLYYENYESFLPTRTSFKVTDEEAFLGNHSLKITNYYSNIPRNTYSYTGTENNDYYTPVFAVEDTFKYLQGYYKYVPEGNDTTLIMFRTWEKGISRSYDYMLLTEKDDWTFFTLPIRYYAATIMPDSATMLVYSSYGDSIVGANSALYLDGLELVMKPQAVSVEELSETIFLYPNPAQTKVTVVAKENCELAVYDPVGSIISTQKILAGQNTIDIAAYNTGIYFFNFNTKTKQWTTRILKQ